MRLVDENEELAYRRASLASLNVSDHGAQFILFPPAELVDERGHNAVRRVGQRGQQVGAGFRAAHLVPSVAEYRLDLFIQFLAVGHHQNARIGSGLADPAGQHHHDQAFA